MFDWLNAHGTPSLDSAKCGPCERTGVACVRHLSMKKKCALCFRGHDVCEMWDESVLSVRRRRVSVALKKVGPVSPPFSVIIEHALFFCGY